jgi:hypothetical protein
MAADLVGGRYPVTYPFAKALGLVGTTVEKPAGGNITQGNICARSNAEWFGLAGWTDGALGTSEVGTVVAVPVELGDEINKITVFVGATKGKKVEAGFAALYQALNAKNKAEEQPLLAQSKSAKLGEEVLAEKPLTFTLETPVIVTSERAPYGFLYVVVVLEAETMPTAAAVSTPKATQAAVPLLFTNAPVVLSGTVGSGFKTNAEATLGAVTSKAVAPIVSLS